MSNENTTAVGTYTARTPKGDGITWDIYSTDSDEFSFTSSGSSLTLRFESAPDYEESHRCEYQQHLCGQDPGY